MKKNTKILLFIFVTLILLAIIYILFLNKNDNKMYETKFNEKYKYMNNESRKFVNALNPEWTYYLRKNINTNKTEVCGVFSKGTVCLSNNIDGRFSEFGKKDNDKYIVSGYTKAKKEEMERKGAKCIVSSFDVECKNDEKLECFIEDAGDVYCTVNDIDCVVDTDGSSYCY